jgi:NAD+ diphosphatase
MKKNKHFLDMAFCENALNRHSDKRDDQTWLEAQKNQDNARFIWLHNQEVVYQNQSPFFHKSQIKNSDQSIFLGTQNDTPYLAVYTSQDQNTNQIMSLREAAIQKTFSQADLSILSCAKALGAWHDTHQHCAKCGHPTTMAHAGWRKDCAACKAQHFPRTDPVIIMLIVHEDACLLGRQKHFPEKMYSCLAGFVEPGETLEQAVARESFEEAGLELESVRYFASQPWPFPTSLMVGFIAYASSKTMVLGENELEDARWFTKSALKDMLNHQHHEGFVTGQSHAIATQMIRSYVEGTYS